MVLRNTLSGVVGTVLCLGTSQVSILTIMIQTQVLVTIFRASYIQINVTKKFLFYIVSILYEVLESNQYTTVTISELEGNRKMQCNGSGKQISPIQEKLSIIQEEWNMVAVAVERLSLFLYIFSFFIIILAYV